MRTAQSQTTGNEGIPWTAKHRSLLLTVAALAFLTAVGVVSQEWPAAPKATWVETSSRPVPAPLRAAGAHEGARYRLITRLGRLSILRGPEVRSHPTGHAEQHIRDLCAVSTQVFFVGSPIGESSAAGWNRGFTSTLPCTSIERSCGANGTILVSSPNGIHICPDGTPLSPDVTGTCDGYSTGSFRFVRTMVAAITQCPQPAPALLV